MMDSQKAPRRLYVYALKADGRVFYVGKGSGERAMSHLARSHSALVNECITRGGQISIDVLSWHETPAQAAAEESRVIKTYPPGQLLNVRQTARAAKRTRQLSDRNSVEAGRLGLHIKLPTPVADAFRKACEEEGEAQGTIARRLIREWIEDRKQSGWAAK